MNTNCGQSCWLPAISAARGKVPGSHRASPAGIFLSRPTSIRGCTFCAQMHRCMRWTNDGQEDRLHATAAQLKRQVRCPHTGKINNTFEVGNSVCRASDHCCAESTSTDVNRVPEIRHERIRIVHSRLHLNITSGGTRCTALHVFLKEPFPS